MSIIEERLRKCLQALSYHLATESNTDIFDFSSPCENNSKFRRLPDPRVVPSHVDSGF